MNKNLISKILLTLGFLLLYRLLAYVPTPGIDTSAIKSLFDTNSDNALGLLNMFNGGAAERLSIISLGIMPYITASIIFELVAASFPKIGEMKKDRDGITKYMQYIRYATILITIVQSIGVAVGLQSLTTTSGESAILVDTKELIFLCTVSMTTGTLLLMWIGEQITQKGIGNGISLIIFAGIVSSIPNAIGETVTLLNTGALSFLAVLAILIVVLLTIWIIIYVELGERRLPVTYSKKVMMQNKRVMNYIPVKVNLSGVIPVIFASAILTFPAVLLQSTQNEYLLKIADFLSPSSHFYSFITFIFVVFFSYFYASITFNTKDISENLKRQGGFIPGVRPGEHTKDFLTTIADRLTFSGAIYLGLVATLPWIFVKSFTEAFYFGGTAVLIIVQVALDTMRKIQAQRYMDQYKVLSATGGF